MCDRQCPLCVCGRSVGSGRGWQVASPWYTGAAGRAEGWEHTQYDKRGGGRVLTYICLIFLFWGEALLAARGFGRSTWLIKEVATFWPMGCRDWLYTGYDWPLCDMQIFARKVVNINQLIIVFTNKHCCLYIGHTFAFASHSTFV